MTWLNIPSFSHADFAAILRRAGIDSDWLHWTAQANCIGRSKALDVELPTGADIDADVGLTTTVQAAKRLCYECGVRSECLTFAMRTETDDGFRDEVWGGLTGGERQAISHEADPIAAGVALFASQSILIFELHRIQGGDESWQMSPGSWLEPLTPRDEF